MVTNATKSKITSIGCSPHETHFVLHRFPHTLLHMEDGLRYLGYRLKPLGYKIIDWIWLITKMEKRLNIWYHKYLLRVGRLLLIKAILEATPVYLMSLACLPRGILNRIQNLCCRFLWKGSPRGRIFAWAKWEALSLPKMWGSWGIKRLDDISTAFPAKLGWQLINSNSFWSKVATSK